MLSAKTRKAVLFIAGLTAVAGLVAGFLAEYPSDVPLAHAVACKGSNGYCVSNLRTAAVDVTHLVPGGASGTPVEPDDGESWSITAYWNSATIPCAEMSETATVDVSWSGSGWVLTNKSTTSHILDIQVCNEATCSEVDTHSYGYRLYVEVVDPIVSYRNFNLRQVAFATTAVDDGQELDTGNCTLGSSVTPTSQTFTAYDNGAFECSYSCDNSGTSLTISYE